MDQRHIDELGGLHCEDPGPYSWSRAPRPITTNDIRDLEAELGHRLPEDYAAFLLRFNEGAVSFGKPARFRLTGGELAGWIYLDWFHSLLLEDRAPGYDLWTNYRMEQGLIPAYLLPIIGNALGSYACVAISGPRRGAVFFWEHELIDYESEEPTDEGVFFVAPSFDAFLDLIEVNDEDA
jgi:hypothetical protein